MLLPLKQGLKQYEVDEKTTWVEYGLSGSSIKTRIETEGEEISLPFFDRV